MDKPPTSLKTIPVVIPALKNKIKTRRYNEAFLKYGFTKHESVGGTVPKCVVCCQVLANSSMVVSKLKRHLESVHPQLKFESEDYFRKLKINLEQYFDQPSKAKKPRLSEPPDNSINVQPEESLTDDSNLGISDDEFTYEDIIVKEERIDDFDRNESYNAFNDEINIENVDSQFIKQEPEVRIEELPGSSTGIQSNKTEVNNDYGHFGKYVVTQLQALPVPIAVQAQMDVVKVLTTARSKAIELDPSSVK